MEIQYMQQLIDNPNLKPSMTPNEPMTEQEILALESKYNGGNPFPKAFKEYLFIAGKGGQTGIVWNDWDMLQEDLEETLEVCNLNVSRPIFPFNMEDGSTFTFFYLDEDKEDPDCYLLIPPSVYSKDKSNFIKSANGYTFSGLINEAIHRIKNGIRF